MHAKDLTRRTLFKRTAAVSAMAGFMPLVADAKDAAAFDVETDVVVIGTGAAGSSAAARAAELGLKVVVLEKIDRKSVV